MRFSPSAARLGSLTTLFCKINHLEIYLVNLKVETFFQILKSNPGFLDLAGILLKKDSSAKENLRSRDQ